MTPHLAELLRYGINGFVATVVHYLVFVINLQIFEMQSAGLANFYGALTGISCSFLGSRCFVFPLGRGRGVSQAKKFGAIYGASAVMHAAVLTVWTDWNGLDHRAGFLLASGLQVILSYLGNKFWVFRP